MGQGLKKPEGSSPQVLHLLDWKGRVAVGTIVYPIPPHIPTQLEIFLYKKKKHEKIG